MVGDARVEECRSGEREMAEAQWALAAPRDPQQSVCWQFTGEQLAAKAEQLLVSETDSKNTPLSKSTECSRSIYIVVAVVVCYQQLQGNITCLGLGQSGIHMVITAYTTRI